MKKNNINNFKLFLYHLRLKTLEIIYKSKSSHIGSCFSCADIIAVLYHYILKFNSKNPKLSTRDRFILSKGHAAAILYSALALKNFFSIKSLDKYGQNNSKYMAHVSHRVDGVEFSTGSLGHGLPFAVGKAYIAKLNKKKFRIFTLISDGELNEGSNWEAIMFASHHNLNNLVVILDYNKLQSLTTNEETLKLEPLKEKLLAFDWNVKEIDGHNHLDIKKTLLKRESSNQAPLFVIANTIKGKGVTFMENKVEWHYKSPTKLEYEAAQIELKDKYA